MEDKFDEFVNNEVLRFFELSGCLAKLHDSNLENKQDLILSVSSELEYIKKSLGEFNINEIQSYE